MLQRHSQSLLTILKSNLRQILEGFYWYWVALWNLDE
jgi:hypothetical protein